MEYKWFKRFYREKPDKVWSGYTDSWITDFSVQLGKISSIEFELQRGAFLGLNILFSIDGGSGGVGTDFTTNMYKGCKYKSIEEKNAIGQELLQLVYDMLEDAKVEKVSDLKNIPVELFFNGKGFCGSTILGHRILIEVL